MAATGRHGSRRLLVQALYQRQVSGHGAAELTEQFAAQKDFGKVDVEYFRQLLAEIIGDSAALDALISGNADRPIEQLDPVEHGILWLGVTELKLHPEVPVKVVITESVQLAKEFGAQDGHRYINALLDRLAPLLRTAS